MQTEHTMPVWKFRQQIMAGSFYREPVMKVFLLHLFIVSGFAYDNKSAKIVTEDTADSDAGLDQGDRAGSGSKSSPQFWL